MPRRHLKETKEEKREMKNNLTKAFSDELRKFGLVIVNESEMSQVPPEDYSFAKQIYNNRQVLLPLLVKIALSLKNGAKIDYDIEDQRDKGAVKQFLDNLKAKHFVNSFALTPEGRFSIAIVADEDKRRFFRSSWAEQCFRYVIMRTVQSFCNSHGLSHKVMQNVELKREGEENLFTELDIVVQIEQKFYVFEIKSGPWIRIMQWARREEALVHKNGAIRNIVCTIHEGIPAKIFEPQILLKLNDFDEAFEKILKEDFCVVRALEQGQRDG